MASTFSASPSGLSLAPPSITGGRTNATAYGNAVNLGNIWKANRDGGFDPSSFLATNTEAEGLETRSAIKNNAEAFSNTLSAISSVNDAKKDAKAIKDAAKAKAKKSIFGSALGAVAGIGGTILSGGNPLVGMAAAKGGQALGSAFG
jgi:hypothetical protein